MTVSFPMMSTPVSLGDWDEGASHRHAQAPLVDLPSPQEGPRSDLDAHFRLLDLLFAEAEALTHGNRGKAMSALDRRRLSTLTREIDALLDQAEGLPSGQPAREAELAARQADMVERLLSPEAHGDGYERLDSFEEDTVDEVLLAHGSRAVAAKVRPTDALNLARLDGPLTLDVENALDRITAQIDLGVAMNLHPAEVLTPPATNPLSGPQAARIDAVFACMDRILAACPDHFLTGEAQTELEALMNEADRILGISGEEELLPEPAARRDQDAWRRAMTILGRQVSALIPGLRVLPA